MRRENKRSRNYGNRFGCIGARDVFPQRYLYYTNAGGTYTIHTGDANGLIRGYDRLALMRAINFAADEVWKVVLPG